MTDNPWMSLPATPPYVLPIDQPMVDAFNQRYKDNDRRTLRLDISPEPFIGSLDAPIVLLYLNPGYTEDDLLLHTDVTGQSLWRENLHQDPLEYPFYMLDPRIQWAPGARWWRRTLNKLIAGADEKTVANSFLCVEYFPYHSKGDPRFPDVLPSQLFGFHLVNQAIDRGALILLTRSIAAWKERIPRLNNYRYAFETKNPQQAIIGPGNYPDGFPVVIDRLSRRAIGP